MNLREALYKLTSLQEFEVFIDYLKKKSEDLDKVSTPFLHYHKDDTLTTESKIVSEYVWKIMAKQFVDDMIYQTEHYEKFFKDLN